MFDQPEPIPSPNNPGRDLAQPPYPRLRSDETGLDDLDERLTRIERLEYVLDRITDHLIALTRERAIAREETKDLLDKTRIATSTIRGFQHLFAMRVAEHERTIAARVAMKKAEPPKTAQKESGKKISEAIAQATDKKSPKSDTKKNLRDTTSSALPAELQKIADGVTEGHGMLDKLRKSQSEAGLLPD